VLSLFLSQLSGVGISQLGGASWSLIYPEKIKTFMQQIPDVTKLTWQLNVALMSAAFSAISLIYNEKYIYFGFVTFLFGVISHFVSTWFDFVYKDEGQRVKRAKFYIVQTLLILVWIIILLIIY